jgi:glycosyltransferase involved in cell wall biosynthesis
MGGTNITPENAIFVLLSFEGPDLYSMVGGLGMRETCLSRALARAGFLTHLFFIGDPALRGEQPALGGRLILHRWCQWISRYHPGDAYQGEDGKVFDFNRSIPPFVIDRIVRPAANEGKLVVIMGEDWQTAEAVRRISVELRAEGLRDNVVMFWNANNTYGFNRIDLEGLSEEITLTTVSKYMKHVMWGLGLDPLVIPNGIPRQLLRKVQDGPVADTRKALGADVMLFKIARWHRDKRWDEAIEATARLNDMGVKTMLVARGGNGPSGAQLMSRARAMGLKVAEATSNGGSVDTHIAALRRAAGADVINVKFHVPARTSRVLYRAADGVLANSAHEPFGLVGLEAMAAGGLAYTGCTGEDYAIPMVNSVVLETEDPMEIVGHITRLRAQPRENERIRMMARRTARQFTWHASIQVLLGKLADQACVQGMRMAAAWAPYIKSIPRALPGLGLVPEPEVRVPAPRRRVPALVTAVAGAMSFRASNAGSANSP